MAVYEQTYRRYAGRLVPPRWRFLVLSRHAVSNLKGSKLFLITLTLSFVVPLGVAVILYMRQNLEALEALGWGSFLAEQLAVDERFFHYFLRTQAFAAFLLTILAAPGLVAPDLTHNALPLYLSRPLSRSGYVLGKITVLWAVLSLVTWVPGVLLIGFQVQLAGFGWLAEHGRALAGVVGGSVVWILLLSLLGLALSAWVRWRTVAAGLLFAVFVVSEVLGEVLAASLNTPWGRLVDLRHLVAVISHQLFFGQPRPESVPLWAAWIAFAAVCGVALALLRWKLEAYEVVR